MNEAITPAGLPKKSVRKKLFIVAGGTAVVLLVAGVAMQFRSTKESVAADASQPAGRAAAPQATKALGRVNGELIPYDQVAKECMDRYGEEVLDSFINRMIIFQACRKLNIVVTDAEVNEEIVKIAKKFDIPIENWLQVIQSERKLSPLQYRRDIIWPMLALKKLAGAEVQITEDDVQKAFIREFGEHVETRMIMCDTLPRANEAWNLAVKTPDDFSRIARERSVDPTSKALGGKIPVIRRYAGNENIENEAFKLKKGEISGIIDVSTPDMKRYVILQCEGRTPQRYQSIDAPNVRQHLQQMLEEEKTQQAVARIFERIKKEAQVENYITQSSTKGIQQVSGVAGRSGVTQAGAARVRAPQTTAGRPAPNAAQAR